MGFLWRGFAFLHDPCSIGGDSAAYRRYDPAKADPKSGINIEWQQ